MNLIPLFQFNRETLQRGWKENLIMVCVCCVWRAGIDAWEGEMIHGLIYSFFHSFIHRLFNILAPSRFRTLCPAVALTVL